MKKAYIIIILGILLSVNAMAENETALFGYYESQFMGTSVNEKLEQLQSNKLRIDIEYTPSEMISFAANLNYITYHGKKEWPIMDYLAPRIVNSVPEQMQSIYTIPFEDRQYLDNAYIRLSLKDLDITFGKQQLSFGSGYVWNPTDVFNTKDVLDPTYEQPGHNAIRFDIPVGANTNITTLYAPKDTWSESGKLLQIKTQIPRFDVSAVFVEKQWAFHDYSQFDLSAGYFEGQPETRRVYGGNIEGELLGLGLYAEYGFNQMDITDDFQELVIGTNYTFDFQTFFMAEYFLNDLGKERESRYNLNDWMRYFAAEQKSVSKEQLYLLVQHPVTDFIDIGIMNITSISDGSAAIVPTMNWSFAEDVEITAYINMNIGNEESAFSRTQGNGGLVRARIYF